MFQIAVLASGNGTNFEAMAQAVRKGELFAEIGLVLCNVPSAGVIEKAAGYGVPVEVVPSKGIKEEEAREAYDKSLGDRLEAAGIDLIVLAGYMRILRPSFIRRFANRIVNIHPSLLPAFPGLNVHQAVLDYGCKVSGCTVHFVDEGVDTGPIIAQASVPVLEGDTVDSLASRIHEAEHRLYPWAVDQIARGRARVEGRRVHLSDEAGLPPLVRP